MPEDFLDLYVLIMDLMPLWITANHRHNELALPLVDYCLKGLLPRKKILFGLNVCIRYAHSMDVRRALYRICVEPLLRTVLLSAFISVNDLVCLLA